MACRAELFLHAGQAIGIDVDQSNVPAALCQDPSGDSADSGRTARAGDDRSTRVRQPG
jgi:hypothetical protein